MLQAHAFDLVVVGAETEACLAAVAAAEAGAKVALLIEPHQVFGGLLTEGGLAFVDRDSRHEFVPGGANADGMFGRFLQRAGVRIVALEPARGRATLLEMLTEAGVTIIRADWREPGRWRAPVIEGDRLVAVTLSDGTQLDARYWLDATPDGDLLEAAGGHFTDGFSEYGIAGYLGVSPLPLIDGVDAATIGATCEQLARDPALIELRTRTFGDRRFLDLDVGEDYVLVGPPFLGLAYQRWREASGLDFPYPFQADGFNVAMVGPGRSSWNGLIYFAQDLATLLRLSRHGADAVMQAEADLFVRFLREGLGWDAARLVTPTGMYVRQSRHALATRHRLSLADIAAGYDRSSVGTFAYYADFRGFATTPIPRPLTAHVLLDAGRSEIVSNLAIASRAGGYTPFAHSLCRLVQYNVTLGTGYGIAAALAEGDWRQVPAEAVRAVMASQGILADDPAGLAENTVGQLILRQDALYSLETATGIA